MRLAKTSRMEELVHERPQNKNTLARAWACLIEVGGEFARMQSLRACDGESRLPSSAEIEIVSSVVEEVSSCASNKQLCLRSTST